MSALRQIWRIMAGRPRRRVMGWALLLAALVLLGGAGLLALSGWFITAAAVAGAAGVGATFDVFRPAAAVRGLAVFRTAARYGERWFGHDATLRGVVALRSAVLTGLSQLGWREMARLRRGPALARVIADTDVLDGLPLRLVLPFCGAVVTFGAAFALLWALTGWVFALWIVGAHVLGAGAAALWGLPRAAALAPGQLAASEAFRTRTLDLVAARDVLAVHGLLPETRAAALAAEAEARALTAALDRIERGVGLALEVTRGVAVAGALALGGIAVEAGHFSPGLAAMGVFLALALGEVSAPLRRATADFGRIRDAAGRVAPVLSVQASDPEPIADPGTALPLKLGALSLGPGQMLALLGPSGVGKSTLLARIAGVLPPKTADEIRLGGVCVADWSETALRRELVLVPQRPALIAGSLRDNLRLAAPEASDAELAQAMAVVCLDGLREGLDLRLGDGGAGLSGGERRRLALARAILRRPALLLLDEPTEGLDPETAHLVLRNLRDALPQSAIVTATHRRGETLRADFVMELR
ncbi:amino acid ABC transporter ATP-binding/permease protein [Paracoccus aminophilus]|uniref:ATP-binding/permease protein CydC n=1 Tax=Paracoccus aminophilus JCM 7686 TaxID=1367847 RepID=S5XR93_PARAH|nr:ATP-binding cassette domain-containing protein [Paracoccus aminophilus]AGT07567.1 ATP-binding/permease protein CydC [Paracoccus aminophilus JCM 7686]